MKIIIKYNVKIKFELFLYLHHHKKLNHYQVITEQKMVFNHSYFSHRLLVIILYIHLFMSSGLVGYL